MANAKMMLMGTKINILSITSLRSKSVKTKSLPRYGQIFVAQRADKGVVEKQLDTVFHKRANIAESRFARKESKPPPPRLLHFCSLTAKTPALRLRFGFIIRQHDEKAHMGAFVAYGY